MFLGQVINVNVVIDVLSLPILLLTIIRMHDLDSLGPLNLFLLCWNFTFFGLNLFNDWVSEIQVLDLCQHKGGQVVRVLTVARAVLSIKPVAAADNAEYLDVLRQ